MVSVCPNHTVIVGLSLTSQWAKHSFDVSVGSDHCSLFLFNMLQVLASEHSRVVFLCLIAEQARARLAAISTNDVGFSHFLTSITASVTASFHF